MTIARDNQRALRESGRVKIPGADAKPEEIKAYREAIGVPETVDGYEIKLPEGLDPEKYEVDGKFLNPLREVALANNVPAAAFGKFAEAFMALQAEQISQEGAANNQARDAKLKEWGANSPTKREEFKRGAEALGLDKNAINRIQAGFGVGETMELLARIGHMAGEDFFANGKAAERFGVSDLASAQAALDKMISDPETAKTLRNKSDPALIAKYNRLTEAVGHYKSLEARS